jgi:hypothetical protein
MYIIFLLLTVPVLLFSPTVLGHCDTLDGPVVTAAKKSLETGNLNLVLIWVQNRDEKEIREAFQKALIVRKTGGTARELADRYFFETLVRVHRAGEGAPYTGLKATSDFGPAIPAADKAIATSNLEPLVKLMNAQVQEGLKQGFHKVVHSKKFDASDVSAGREYVKNYVSFVHYVERLFGSTQVTAHGHFPENEAEFHHEE